MCLIVTRSKADTLIPANILIKGYRLNPDGWGIMYPKKNNIIIRKGIGDKADMLKEIEKAGDVPIAIHFRYATYGEVDIHNCHPFKVTNDLFMMHNGVLNSVEQFKPHMSDTWHYAKYHLNPLLQGAEDKLDDPTFQTFLSREIGIRNKIVFMRSDGKMFIINEFQGLNHKGLWLSNDSGLPSNHYKQIGFAPVNEKKTSISPGNLSTALATVKAIPPGNGNEMGGNKYFIGYLVRTPEYFGLPENRAYIYYNQNKKLKKGIKLSKQETDFYDSCKKIVTRCIEMSNIKEIDLPLWCKIMRDNYKIDVEHKLKKTLEDFDISEAELYTPMTKITLANGSPRYLHFCILCRSRSHTEFMWFNDYQMKDKLDGREGTCNTCHDRVFNNKSHTYTPGPQTVEWVCSSCKKDQFFKNSWSSKSTEAEKLCYSCIDRREKEAKLSALVADAEFCGVTDPSVMSTAEIAYWKTKDWTKKFFEPVKTEVTKTTV